MPSYMCQDMQHMLYCIVCTAVLHVLQKIVFYLQMLVFEEASIGHPTYAASSGAGAVSLHVH